MSADPEKPASLATTATFALELLDWLRTWGNIWLLKLSRGRLGKDRRKFTRRQEERLKATRNLITEINVWLLRVSKGRLGNTFLGVSVLLLTTVGRRSGDLRTMPIFFMADGDRYVLVASNAGNSHDPAWLMNIHANPAVSVELRGKMQRMSARLASDAERAELWPRLIVMFPKWKMMAEHSPRQFPLVLLEQLGAPAAVGTLDDANLAESPDAAPN